MVSRQDYEKRNKETLKAQAYELQSSLDLLITSIKQNKYAVYLE